MKKYYFNQPLFKNNTEKKPIIDDEGKILGYIQRIFSNKSHFIFGLIFNDLFLHLNVYDEHNRLIIKIREKLNLSIKDIFRSKWEYTNIKFPNKIQKLKDETMIKTNPSIIFEFNDEIYRINGDIGDRTIRVFNEDNRIIATINAYKIVPTKSVEIKLYEENGVDILTLCAFYYLFDLNR